MFCKEEETCVPFREVSPNYTNNLLGDSEKELQEDDSEKLTAKQFIQ